ncbi:MAG: gliding motility-associated C-terminal domain-containing protein [Spirochaetaceae bacterium]|jgi:flagellar hook assembly protein FlgD/outer membrane protein OmpA-like peptidoglycan-associated protein|nr:gliding motility-associated C-terminal domain-containing protein [Spirochaetaceae bacterium]
MTFKKNAAALCLFLGSILSGFADQPIGVDALAELYAPLFAGPGIFTTSQGAATASAFNPAAGGGAQLINFDAAYMGLSGAGDEGGFGHAVAAGALLPTKYAVFGASLRFLTSPFDSFDVGTTFGGNFNVAKELYPGMSAGAGLNFGFGDDWSLALDLGFRYNLGRIWRFNNVTWALALKNFGKSYPAPAFTPVTGIALDLLTIAGKNGKSDPLRLKGAVDLGFPGCTTMSAKTGLELAIAGLIVISSSLDFNVRELIEDTAPPLMPSIGLFLKFTLENTGRTLPDDAPSSGEMSVRMGAKPLPADIWGISGGVSLTVGVPDNKAPVIMARYPETQWISPNNDGLADDLEFPVSITDQRYVMEWAFEIQNEAGETVRVYRNKERRPETQGKVRNIISRLADVKSGVDIPETLRWDGILESGSLAPDGRYFFVISASDDNGNRASTGSYEVYIDTVDPEIELERLSGQDRIFSPDGDGNKDVLRISQTGSEEELWDIGIYDTSGGKVKSFDIRNGAPGDLVWDGTDDKGDFVPDGVYSYRISATDRAQNTSDAGMENIIVSTIQPEVNLFIAGSFFSPNGDGVKDILTLNPSVPVSDGVVQWLVEIKDASGGTVRGIQGADTVPRNVDFDGKNDFGAALEEGTYQAALAVTYRNGYVSRAQSPGFTLDLTAPSAGIQAGYNAFSPNNDGNQDTMIISQEGSNETLWTGEVRGTQAVVRSFRFTGLPASRVEWDGRDDSGRPAPDGNYEYRLSAVDEAGNAGSSNVLRFSLSTADTPVMISADSRAFSPNGDGVKDTISILPQLQVREGISSYTVDILDSAGAVIRTFEGRGSVPAAISWNGRDNAGTPARDGLYSARIQVIYAMGNQPSAFSQPFTLDTQAPLARLSSGYTLFSPNGDGRKDTLPVTVASQGDDEWQASIVDAQGNEVRSWTWKGSAPALEWNGADRAGNIAPDGNYRFVLRSEDEAGNRAQETISNIVVDSRTPRAFFTVSPQAIAPKDAPQDARNSQARFSVILNPRDGITDWKVEIKDEAGTVRRRFPAAQASQPGSPAGRASGSAAQTGAPPETLVWDGREEGGTVIEGRYNAELTVNYEKGDLVSLSAGPITVDVSGPRLGFSSRPEYFSPDNDGVDDDLYISLTAEDLSPIAAWSLEIREPVAPFNLFYRLEGRGAPASRIVWDGRSGRGELVQAATDYPVKFRASDTLGNSSEIDAVIGVDVLVIRDGDLLRIQVPSIIFRENAADFENLAPDVTANNLRVLRRIAEILNKFQDYRVTVEGHANPVSRTTAEEQNELQPLSEARARAIVDRLTGFGVTRNRLTYVGKGGTRPVVRWEDRDNWWKNRRVEFILIK